MYPSLSKSFRCALHSLNNCNPSNWWPEFKVVSFTVRRKGEKLAPEDCHQIPRTIDCRYMQIYICIYRTSRANKLGCSDADADAFRCSRSRSARHLCSFPPGKRLAWVGVPNCRLRYMPDIKIYPRGGLALTLNHGLDA